MTAKDKTKESEPCRSGNIIWLKEKEAAVYIGRSSRTLKNWRSKGEIVTKKGVEPSPPCYRRAGNYYYRADELDEWLKNGKI